MGKLARKFRVPGTVKLVRGPAKPPPSIPQNRPVSPGPVFFPTSRASDPGARPASSSPSHPGALGSPSSPSTALMSKEEEALRRLARFDRLLSAETVDLAALRKAAWFGIPAAVRGQVWRLLLDYSPASAARREAVLARKRAEYFDAVALYYNVEGGTSEEAKLRHQVQIDVLRTAPETPLFQNQSIQRCLNRILYVWAIRHPASGYVQGINDLVTPFLTVFLDEVMVLDGEELKDPSLELPDDIIGPVEADCFWALSRLLDGIHDHYTFAQPGIQRMVYRLKELVARIDADLVAHLDKENIEFLQFAFRWINCLLLRELPMDNIIRMWDTYLAEESLARAFSDFHLYVCAALLVSFSQQLRALDYQETVMFLQRLPTSTWTSKEVEVIISQAFMFMSLYSHAQSHLKDNSA